MIEIPDNRNIDLHHHIDLGRKWLDASDEGKKISCYRTLPLSSDLPSNDLLFTTGSSWLGMTLYMEMSEPSDR
ncbi:MAG: hypothetical protein VCA57_05595 [Pseudomonas sp.]|uniref:hypothetical protein n=1 Tax=Pseudomonas sp. TaxID=306 RepID=UPI003981B04A